jgi:hypothetical protein
VVHVSPNTWNSMHMLTLACCMLLQFVYARVIAAASAEWISHWYVYTYTHRATARAHLTLTDTLRCTQLYCSTSSTTVCTHQVTIVMISHHAYIENCQLLVVPSQHTENCRLYCSSTYCVVCLPHTVFLTSCISWSLHSAYTAACFACSSASLEYIAWDIASAYLLQL